MKTTLTKEELLVLLMEECAEVIQAASKCLRFGFYTYGPGDYGENDLVLALEVGDMLGVIDALPLNANRINSSRSTKIARAEQAKAAYGKKA